MKSKKWFSGLVAAAFALTLAGADIAAAACGGGVCGRGQGDGRRVCSLQGSKDTCPNFKQGRGRTKDRGNQLCRQRNYNCPYTQANSTAPTPPAPAPSN